MLFARQERGKKPTINIDTIFNFAMTENNFGPQISAVSKNHQKTFFRVFLHYTVAVIKCHQ